MEKTLKTHPHIVTDNNSELSDTIIQESYYYKNSTKSLVLINIPMNSDYDDIDNEIAEIPSIKSKPNDYPNQKPAIYFSNHIKTFRSKDKKSFSLSNTKQFKKMYIKASSSYVRCLNCLSYLLSLSDSK